MKAIVGDIHGCYHTLTELYKTVNAKYGNIPFYSTGDLVDRGLHSDLVISFILEKNFQVVMGNHDYMFMMNAVNPKNFLAELWFYNGCETTLISYREKDKLKEQHLEYLKRLPLFINLEDVFISHAGVPKDVKSMVTVGKEIDFKLVEEWAKLSVETENGILWTRRDLLNIKKLQVVGHTPKRKIVYLPKSNVAYIDTWAFYDKFLSAVIVDEGKIIDQFSIPTIKADVYD